MLKNNNNGELNFEQYVLDMLLESTPGAVKDFYLSLHPEDEGIDEGEIEWFRKIYSKRRPSPANFTFIAKNRFETSFFVHEIPSDAEIMMLLEYCMDNYMGYVEEFHDGDVNKAPRFSYGLIAISNRKEEMGNLEKEYTVNFQRKR